jgi:hypothetical protein
MTARQPVAVQHHTGALAVRASRVRSRCALQVQYRRAAVKLRCFQSWSAPWCAAQAHWRRQALRKALRALQAAVCATQELLAPHIEYWQQGAPLLKAWKSWLQLMWQRKCANVRTLPA